MGTAAPSWQCVDRALDLSAPVVMGVLNVTPDSFSDGGRFHDPQSALAQAHRMVGEGIHTAWRSAPHRR
jgi:dihydropteroate synthase